MWQPLMAQKLLLVPGALQHGARRKSADPGSALSFLSGPIRNVTRENQSKGLPQESSSAPSEDSSVTYVNEAASSHPRLALLPLDP